MRQCGEDPSGSSSCGLHAASYDGDQCQVGLDINGIRVCQSVDGRNHLLFLIHELILMNKYGQGIDAGRDMLKGNTIVLKGLQYFAPKAYLRIHHGLFNIDRTEPLLSGYTGNGVPALLAGAFHDPGSCILRTVGIADVDRDPLSSYRKDCILMENAGSHVGKLPQFSVGDSFNSFRLVDDPGICDQEAGYICPVFIYICLDSPCHDRTCHIRTAS